MRMPRNFRGVRRQYGQYIACAFAAAIFGLYVWLLPGWMTKLGSAPSSSWPCSISYGNFIAAVQRIACPMMRPQASSIFIAANSRAGRDLFTTAWRWYILPVIPGMVLMLLGRWFQFHAAGRSLAWDHQVIVLGAIIAALIVAWSGSSSSTPPASCSAKSDRTRQAAGEVSAVD